MRSWWNTMLALIVGIALAAGVTAGPLRWAGPHVSSFSDSIVSALHRSVEELLGKIPGLAENPQVAASLAATAALTAPGMACLALSYAAARAVPAAKQLLSFALVAAAGLSFFFLPATASLPLLLLSLFTGTVLLAPVGFLTSALLWALAGVVAIGHVRTVWSQSSPVLAAGREAFISISGIDSTEFWSFAALVVALSPFAAAAAVAMRRLES